MPPLMQTSRLHWLSFRSTTGKPHMPANSTSSDGFGDDTASVSYAIPAIPQTKRMTSRRNGHTRCQDAMREPLVTHRSRPLDNTERC